MTLKVIHSNLLKLLTRHHENVGFWPTFDPLFKSQPLKSQASFCGTATCGIIYLISIHLLCNQLIVMKNQWTTIHVIPLYDCNFLPLYKKALLDTAQLI